MTSPDVISPVAAPVKPRFGKLESVLCTALVVSIVLVGALRTTCVCVTGSSHSHSLTSHSHEGESHAPLEEAHKANGPLGLESPECDCTTLRSPIRATEEGSPAAAAGEVACLAASCQGPLVQPSYRHPKAPRARPPPDSDLRMHLLYSVFLL